MATSSKPTRIDRLAIQYEKATCPHCGKDIFVRYQREPQAKILGIANSDGVITNAKGNPDIESIYNFWNDQHIIVHKSLTPDMAKAIRATLKDYGDMDIMQAISNYAEIQSGSQYWFKYAWTLKDFLKRGLPKFLDLAIAKANYTYKEPKPIGKAIHKRCTSCEYKALTNLSLCPHCGTRLERDYTSGKYGHLVRR